MSVGTSGTDWLYFALFLLAGGFSLLGGLLNWDWFFNNRRARLFVNMLGRGGARIFYIGLGIVFIVIGFYVTFV